LELVPATIDVPPMDLDKTTFTANYITVGESGEKGTADMGAVPQPPAHVDSGEKSMSGTTGAVPQPHTHVDSGGNGTAGTRGTGSSFLFRFMSSCGLFSIF
jgi:hypothetical protein